MTAQDGEKPDEASDYDLHEGDPTLGLFVKAINAHQEHVEHGQGVTLFVNGLIVVGEIIPAWLWFEEQAPSDPESVMKDIAEAMRVPSTQDPSSAQRPRHIHLRHATFLMPPAIINADMYWRGRISHVSGWTLGQAKIA